MGKHLSEMTLEELWQLFPIILSEHKPGWRQQYCREAERLRSFLPPEITLDHIGSTAVEGIMAKPIVDILAQIPPDSDMCELRDILTHNGYICMSQGENRMSFNRGYTEQGFAQEVFHLHLRYAGDNDELYFRDYLRAHPDKAREYEQLKLKLWKSYEHDRDGYTNAKSPFVAECTERAKNELLKRD